MLPLRAAVWWPQYSQKWDVWGFKMTGLIDQTCLGTPLSKWLTTLPTREDKLVRLSHLLDVSLAYSSLKRSLWIPEGRVRCQNHRAVTRNILRYRRIQSMNKFGHQSGETGTFFSYVWITVACCCLVTTKFTLDRRVRCQNIQLAVFHSGPRKCQHFAASLHIMYRRRRVYTKWTPRRRSFPLKLGSVHTLRIGRRVGGHWRLCNVPLHAVGVQLNFVT